MESEWERLRRKQEPDPDLAEDSQAELDDNHARLAAAAKILLRDTLQQVANFGYDAVISIEEQGGDAEIAGMIRFGIEFKESGYEAADADTEDTGGMEIGILPIENPFVIEDDYQLIHPGEGIEGSLLGLWGTNRLPGNIPVIEGVAMVKDSRDKEQFVPVGVLENGAVFALCEELS